VKNYTVRVTMTISAEIDVEAEDRDEAHMIAVSDYDAIWDQADVVGVPQTNVIEEDGVDV